MDTSHRKDLREAGPGYRRRILLSLTCVVLFVLDGCGREEAMRPAGAPIQFVDVAAESGITMRGVSGGREKKYILEIKGGGAGAFLDYDNDGDLDLYAVNGSRLEGFPPGQAPRNALYRNNGDGTFTDVAPYAGVADTSWGMGCTSADYDNDGDADLYVANFGPNVLYRNNGDGTFTDVAEEADVGDPRWGAGCAFGDCDNDGDLDLYVSNYVDFRRDPEYLHARYIQWRGIKVCAGPRGLDGAADVFYRNNGDGTFTDVTEEAGLVDRDRAYGFGVLFFDYDEDGDQDIFVANDSVRNFLYRNDGDGTFTDVALPSGVGYSDDGREQAGMGVTCGDYDNDGHLDLFMTHFSDDYSTLYRNEGNGFFSVVSAQAGFMEQSWSYLSWGTGFMDYDNDGDEDLFVASGHVYPQVDDHDFGTSYAQTNQLYENRGDGTFREISTELGPGFRVRKVSRGACFGDYDNDGDVDVFVLNLDDTPTLLRNDGGNRRNWLMVRTVGVRSNRDGIGARITVWCGDRSQVRVILGGSSFLCQNDLRAHFGLGERDEVDRLEIRWPSGVVQRLEHVPANRVVVVEEN